MVEITTDKGKFDVTFGCDPEVFIVNKEGKFVCADGLVPGTKDKPFEHEDGMVQVDGFAAEFGIKPAKTWMGFRNRTGRSLGYIQKHLDSQFGKGSYSVRIRPTATFDRDIYQQAPAHSKVLGCDPDFNAWKDAAPNPRPDVGDRPFRTGGGHIHVGFTDYYMKKFGKRFIDDPFHPEHLEFCSLVVREFDLRLGVSSVVFDRDVRRRSVYGRAGAFRPKPYGFEYRSLSNKWLLHESLMKFVHEQAVAAIQTLAEGRVDHVKYKDRIEEVINTEDDKGIYSALAICRDMKIEIPKPPVGFSKADASKRGSK